MSTGTSWVPVPLQREPVCTKHSAASSAISSHGTNIRQKSSSVQVPQVQSLSSSQGNTMESHTRAGIPLILSVPLRSVPNLIHIYIFRSILLQLLSFQSDLILVPVHVPEAMTGTAVKLHYLCTLINSLITINGKSCWQAKASLGIRITNIMVLYIFFFQFQRNLAWRQELLLSNTSSDTAILLVCALAAAYCEYCRIRFVWEMKNRLILKSVRQIYAFPWVFFCREKDKQNKPMQWVHNLSAAMPAPHFLLMMCHLSLVSPIQHYNPHRDKTGSLWELWVRFGYETTVPPKLIPFPFSLPQPLRRIIQCTLTISLGNPE